MYVTLWILEERYFGWVMMIKHICSVGPSNESRRFLLTSCCLLLLTSGCSPLSDNTGRVLTPTAIPRVTTPVATSTPPSNSTLAARIVKGMSLDQKLGQMVIVEFYGS